MAWYLKLLRTLPAKPKNCQEYASATLAGRFATREIQTQRHIFKPNSSIVTTLHGQHWSTLVNIGAQCPAKVLQRIADWWLLELKQSWRGYVMNLLESTTMTIPHQHYTFMPYHAIIFKPIKLIPRVSKIAVCQSMPEYANIFQVRQHSIDTSSEAAASSSWLISWDSLQHAKMQRLLNTVGLCGAGGAGRATGSNHTMSQGEKLARNLHDICAMLRPLRFFWQHGPWWRRPARLAGAHKLHKNHWSYSVHKCTDVDRCRMNILCVCVSNTHFNRLTLGTWRPLSAKCYTGWSSNLNAGTQGPRLPSAEQQSANAKTLKSLTANCFGARMPQTASFENKLFLAH